MSINQSRLKRLAMGIWLSLALSMVLYLAQTSSTHYRAGTMDQSKRGNSTDSLRSQPAGPSTEAQFNPRSVRSVSEAASGFSGQCVFTNNSSFPPGMQEYWDYKGLYFDDQHDCMENGEKDYQTLKAMGFEDDGEFRPNPKLNWI